jgi:uncharacterized protein
MEIPIKKAFDLFHRSSRTLEPTARDEEIELKPGELDVGFFAGEGLEFNDSLRELILMEVPMKPVCRLDCRGLCPQCGANLNAGQCACPVEEADPRWAKLQALKR